MNDTEGTGICFAYIKCEICMYYIIHKCVSMRVHEYVHVGSSRS